MKLSEKRSEELSDVRLDEIMEMFDQTSEDEMIAWIELQPDKDLIANFFNAIVPIIPVVDS